MSRGFESALCYFCPFRRFIRERQYIIAYLSSYRRDRKQVVFFLDEVQVVTGWETFARRMLDTEKVELFVSGSSARLLSREVASSMRGRAMEVLVLPFGFREFLRHRGDEPALRTGSLPKAQHSALDKSLRSYLSTGGFPEARNDAEWSTPERPTRLIRV